MKSGFIAVVGHPNVGKSTFLNAVLGEKVAIVSTKPQTTRHVIRGVYTDEEAQMVFIDTPGIHPPKHDLGSHMRRSALRTFKSVDLVMLMVDALDDKKPLDEGMMKRLREVKTPVFLIINKLDAVRDFERLKDYVDGLKERYPFEAAFAISARKGWHVEELLSDMKAYLEEGPQYFPPEMTSDQPERVLIAERIREKILETTQQEIPHSVAVEIDSITPSETQDDMLDIHATIIVERESQKKIIIGKNGRMIKTIGTRARQDILNLLGSKVYLDLHCKVVKDWRTRPERLRNLGFGES